VVARERSRAAARAAEHRAAVAEVGEHELQLRRARACERDAACPISTG